MHRGEGGQISMDDPVSSGMWGPNIFFNLIISEMSAKKVRGDKKIKWFFKYGPDTYIMFFKL
jgi:hypothetical protein